MSIESHMLRLETAKNDMAAAIENKDVDVPDGAMMADFAALIEKISKGNPDNIYRTTVKPSAYGSSVQIPWPTGKYPKNILMWHSDSGLSPAGYRVLSECMFDRRYDNEWYAFGCCKSNGPGRRATDFQESQINMLLSGGKLNITLQEFNDGIPFSPHTYNVIGVLA